MAASGFLMDMASAQFAGIAFVLALWCACKAVSTLRSSREVPHPNTNRALRRLTSEVGKDPVHSTRYGRQRSPMDVGTVQLALVGCCFCACGAVWLVVVRCRRCAVHLSGCELVRLLSLWSRGLGLSVQPCTCTVAILAQGTSWAVAVTQAFFCCAVRCCCVVAFARCGVAVWRSRAAGARQLACVL